MPEFATEGALLLLLRISSLVVTGSRAFSVFGGIAQIIAFVEVLLDDVDNRVFTLGFVIDDKHLWLGVVPHWLVLVLQESLIFVGLVHTFFHGGRLLLQYLGSKFAWQEVDEEGHANLVEDFVVGFLVSRVAHGRLRCGSIGSRYGLSDDPESIHYVRSECHQVIKGVSSVECRTRRQRTIWNLTFHPNA